MLFPVAVHILKHAYSFLLAKKSYESANFYSEIEEAVISVFRTLRKALDEKSGNLYEIKNQLKHIVLSDSASVDSSDEARVVSLLQNLFSQILGDKKNDLKALGLCCFTMIDQLFIRACLVPNTDLDLLIVRARQVLDLPTEVFLKILQLLPPNELIRSASVSKAWQVRCRDFSLMRDRFINVFDCMSLYLDKKMQDNAYRVLTLEKVLPTKDGQIEWLQKMQTKPLRNQVSWLKRSEDLLFKLPSCSMHSKEADAWLERFAKICLNPLLSEEALARLDLFVNSLVTSKKQLTWERLKSTMEAKISGHFFNAIAKRIGQNDLMEICIKDKAMDDTTVKQIFSSMKPDNPITRISLQGSFTNVTLTHFLDTISHLSNLREFHLSGNFDSNSFSQFLYQCQRLSFKLQLGVVANASFQMKALKAG